MVLIKECLSFSHYKPMETLDPRGGASLDPRGLIGKIYVGDVIRYLTKYISCGPYGFRGEDFSTILSLWKLLFPGVGPVWTPWA